MKVFGITGWKNSGKTTLTSDLVRLFTQHGLTVSTIKHAHHGFDIDKPETDSFKHREAGAREVLISSGKRWALMHELQSEPEATLEQLLNQLTEVDLVLVEGFKSSPHPKLHVVRNELNQDALPDSALPIAAVVSDDDINPQDYHCPGPVLPRSEIETIAKFIAQYCDLDIDL